MRRIFVAITSLSILFSMNTSAEETVATATEVLNKIISDYTEGAKRVDAFWATYYNVEEDLPKFGDYPSNEFKVRIENLTSTARDRLKSVNPDKLPIKDQRAYKLIKGEIDQSVESFKFPWFYLDITQMGGRFLEYLSESNPELTSFPFDSVKHFDDWVKRSEGFLPFVDRTIFFMREGIKKKYVLNCGIANKTVQTFAEALETAVEKNPFYRPLSKLPKDIKKKDRERLTADFKMMINDRIVPGYKKFTEFFNTEYKPKCRKGYGIASLPRGKELYLFKIRSNTGTKLSANEIHNIGLKEVARIRGEIQTIQKALGFKGTLNKFFSSRRNDESNYFKTPQEQIQAFEAVKARVAKLLPKYFSRMPKMDYNVVSDDNPVGPAGSYLPPSENMPLGRFLINTINARSNPKDRTTTLSMHETMPGHHMQAALQFEMKDQLSEYQRKMFNANEFVEGWGLYAEYLGREMGMYTDQFQMLGHLSDEMLRAIRLVVDTGIHAKGWSREKTVKFMSENVAADISDIEIEADRYSIWPGQALGYKIGQLKILELRGKAEKILGDKFDIRGFHEAVIGNGTVSLAVMEEQINDWIEQAKK